MPELLKDNSDLFVVKKASGRGSCMRMKYLYEDEVRGRGGEFSLALKAAGFEASVEDDSARDYMIKIAVRRGGSPCGKIRIYYKPSKKKFTMDSTELTDKSVSDIIQSVWDGKSVETVKDMREEKSGADPEYSAYVDGSFIRGAIGYGSVVIRGDEIVEEFSGTCDEPEAASQRQVPGEIEAVKKTIAWCKKKKVERISIYYDYAGLEKWAIGEWKTNNTITKSYAAYMKKCGIEVIWKKVKSHTGNRWNDHADMLAKRAVLS